MHLDIEAFSSLRYVGVQTIVPPTNFKDLRNAVIAELENTTVRSSRNARIVFLALKVRLSNSIKMIQLQNRNEKKAFDVEIIL